MSSGSLTILRKRREPLTNSPSSSSPAISSPEYTLPTKVTGDLQVESSPRIASTSKPHSQVRELSCDDSPQNNPMALTTRAFPSGNTSPTQLHRRRSLPTTTSSFSHGTSRRGELLPGSPTELSVTASPPFPRDSRRNSGSPRRRLSLQDIPQVQGDKAIFVPIGSQDDQQTHDRDVLSSPLPPIPSSMETGSVHDLPFPSPTCKETEHDGQLDVITSHQDNDRQKITNEDAALDDCGNQPARGSSVDVQRFVPTIMSPTSHPSSLAFTFFSPPSKDTEATKAIATSNTSTPIQTYPLRRRSTIGATPILSSSSTQGTPFTSTSLPISASPPSKESTGDTPRRLSLRRTSLGSIASGDTSIREHDRVAEGVATESRSDRPFHTPSRGTTPISAIWAGATMRTPSPQIGRSPSPEYKNLALSTPNQSNPGPLVTEMKGSGKRGKTNQLSVTESPGLSTSHSKSDLLPPPTAPTVTTRSTSNATRDKPSMWESGLRYA